jgi:membrane associated rhomboid family serine protease
VARTVFGGLPRGGRPVVTQAIIAICVAVFVVQMTVGPRVTESLAFYPPLAIAEPYRFLTAAFLHSTDFLLHIVFNLYALWIVGPYLEGLLGRLQYALLYLLSALGGSVGYFLLANPDVPQSWNTSTVGASGAVFGLFGAFLVVNRRLGRDVAGILGVLLVNAVISLLPGIAWQAHAGGFVTGLVTALVLAYLPRERAPVRWAAMAAIALVLVGAVAARTSALPQGAEVSPAQVSAAASAS